MRPARYFFVIQLSNSRAGETEVLCDYDTKKTVRLKSLIPDWWGPHS